MSPIQLLVGRENGGQMIYFQDPEVQDLAPSTKARLLQETGKRVRKKRSDLLNDPLALEFLVFFKTIAGKNVQHSKQVRMYSSITIFS